MKTSFPSTNPIPDDQDAREGHGPTYVDRAATDPLRAWSWVQSITSLSRTTVWRLVKDGAFPAPIRISPGRVAWRQSEVVAWLDARRDRTRHVALELEIDAQPVRSARTAIKNRREDDDD